MTRYFSLVLLAAVTTLGMENPSPSVSSDQSAAVTFNKDVLPVVQKNCQSCHHPGGIAPMSFLTYESTRPWAKAIKSAVVNRKMPPWFADPHVGEFSNAPSLTQADIDTLAAWADNGAREGNPSDKPAPPEFREAWREGWRIPPDVIVSMPEEYRVAAKGAGEVREFFVENPFKEDTWVSSIEIRPGDPSVVHHVIVQIPEQQQLRVFKSFVGGPAAAAAGGAGTQPLNQQDVLALVNAAGNLSALRVKKDGGQGVSAYNDMLVKLQEMTTGRGAFMTMEAVYAPGTSPLDFRSSKSAKLVRGGQPIRIEMHYTPNGKETADRTSIGFTLAKDPGDRRFVIMAPEHLVDTRQPIPAGAANYETRGELTFTEDAELAWFMPHMHLRGKDMTYELIYPDGREETVLKARFDFNWQLGYEVKDPIRVPKGTRMIVTAHHDNSANNPFNPAPGQAAAWGEMTSQEMMLPWFGVVVDRDIRPEAIAVYRPGYMDGSGPVGVGTGGGAFSIGR